MNKKEQCCKEDQCQCTCEYNDDGTCTCVCENPDECDCECKCEQKPDKKKN